MPSSSAPEGVEPAPKPKRLRKVPKDQRKPRNQFGHVGRACVSRFTSEKEQAFLDSLSAGSTVAGAARKIGYTSVAMFVRRRDDNPPGFAARWAAAQDLQTDALEDEALRRTAKSDTLLIFMLNARKPDVYRPRSQNTPGVSGEDAARIVREAIDRMEAATSTPPK